MDQDATLRALAALGQAGRLSVFRLLMRFAPQGVRPTEIAQALGLKPNTLSHYLAELEDACLVRSERHGRSLYYCVRLDQVAGFVDHLLDDCCRGRPDICLPASIAARQRKSSGPWNVLFLCSGNSARSIFAEAILRRVGGTRFAAFSAGTAPAREINPFVRDLLVASGMDPSGLLPKARTDFTSADAPRMDFVITVCDLAAAEDSAPLPGQPLMAHWGMKDPATATVSEQERRSAFETAFAQVDRRVRALADLPIRDLEDFTLQRELDRIGGL